jgi:hypothetical protein
VTATPRPLSSQPGEVAARTGASSTAAPPNSRPITVVSEAPPEISRAAVTA